MTRVGAGGGSLADHVRTVLHHRGFVAALTSTAVLLAGAYALLATPVFRADTLLQIEARTKGFAGLEGVSPALSEKNQADTEIEILRSRTVLGSVVDRLNLTLEVAPRTFPVVGRAMLRLHDGRGTAAPLLGLSSYAWGGERIQVQQLELPEALLNARLRLIANPWRRFQLLNAEGEELVSGEVGQPARAGEGENRVEILASELVARPGTQFEIARRSRDDVIRDLQRALRITEKGKKTGILTVAIEGHDPSRIAAIVDAISQAYQRQNEERRMTEAASSLDLIEKQLPVLRANLEAAENALKSHQAKNNLVDLSLETQALLQRIAQIEQSASSLELTRNDLRSRYTGEHPLLQTLSRKAGHLHRERHALEEKMRQLPQQEATHARLTRNLKVASELYFMLLSKAQELSIAKSGTIGNVRILDTAGRPEEVAPKRLLLVTAALLFGLLLSVTWVLTREALEQSVNRPEQIEGVAGVAVCASVPHSARQAALSRRRTRARSPVLAIRDAGDPAIESLRSLRTGLHSALNDASGKVVCISSPCPDVGKSFVCVNLAHVFSQTGERVLLVDGDLRRGGLHRYFGAARSPGLAELLDGDANLRDVSRPINDSLHLVATGKLPPNPAELLASERFRAFVVDASHRYDLVLVDAPPILAVTDAALIARHACMNLLVLRAGRHTAQEISQALKGPVWGGSTAHWVVLNDVTYDGRGGGYSSRYEYRSLDEKRA